MIVDLWWASSGGEYCHHFQYVIMVIFVILLDGTGNSISLIKNSGQFRIWKERAHGGSRESSAGSSNCFIQWRSAKGVSPVSSY
jgi:hypothetical protein